jgi:uncharacterized membrane protein
MSRKQQVHSEVVIDAPLQAVWEYCMDISKIPEFHPRVDRVDYLSGTKQRAPGVSYQCNVLEGPGRGTCVEQVTEVVPMERFTTTIPDDSWGLSKLFADYVVETRFTPIGSDRTKVEFRQYYATNSVKAKVANVLARRRIASQTADTLKAIKLAVEQEHSKLRRP